MIVLPLRHELACSAETYWACVLDPEYAARLFVGELGFVRYDVLEQRDRVSNVLRRVRAEPSHKDVPGMLHSMLGYIEESDLDRRRSLYNFRTINEARPGSVDVRGFIHAQPLHASRCVRTCEIHINVKALGLGGWVERRMAEDLTKSYGVSARFTDWWVAAREAAEARIH